MPVFAALPLLALPVAAYNLIALLLMPNGLHSTLAQDRMLQPLFSLTTASGGVWSAQLGDLIVFAALVILFIELLKSTTSRNVAIINHMLSLVLFIVCLLEFLLLQAFATSVFFLLTSMVLLDVLAGFIITIVASRRDIDIGGP
jgi:hypothetical protein